MPVFPLLADPTTYEPCTIKISDPIALEIWLKVFEKQVPTMAEHAAASEGNTDSAKARAEQFATEHLAQLASIRLNPNAFGTPNVLVFCDIREKSFRKYGFKDPYLPVKSKENAAALALLPSVFAKHDALGDDERLKTAMDGVFAGNIFDMGALVAVDMYAAGQLDFFSTVSKLRRPFLIDHTAAFAARLNDPSRPPLRKAMMFVDNAGSDVLLGMVPFARELVRRGLSVVIACNSEPSVNDITYAELAPLLPKIEEIDSILGSAYTEGRFKVVASGDWLPVIDLAQVSEECAAEAADADLVVLEGMGRSLETNFNAKFTTDSLKMAMVKHPEVAAFLGGSVLDVVCKYETGSAPLP